MKILTQASLTLALGALLTTAAGCSKDAAPDSMTRDVIIETGYVECGAPDDACDGVAQCVEANDAQICVQAPADQCVDALTCDCVGAWVCGDLPCVDLDGGFACGDAPDEPPPPMRCLRVAPGALDFGRVLVSDAKELSVTVIADCPARVDSVFLLEGTDPAYSLAAGVELVDLAEGDSIAVTVRVEPSEAEQLTGTLRINDDPSLDVPLTTEAERPIGGNCLMAEATTLDFGAVAVGATARISVQVAANCDGDLAGMLDRDNPDADGFTLVEPVDGPVQAGEGFALTVDFTPQAPGDAQATFTLSGAGQPLEFTLMGAGVEPIPDCREDGVGCLGGLDCNGLGICVNLTTFIFEFEEGAPEMFIQFWPNEQPYLLIESADNEFTGFNPGSPLLPCDACDGEDDCAVRPAVVGAVSQMGARFGWGGLWWLTDNPNAGCATPIQAPDGLYLARLCGAREADVQGEFSQDGRALGTINQSFCTQPVQFEHGAGDDVILMVPAL